MARASTAQAPCTAHRATMSPRKEAGCVTRRLFPQVPLHLHFGEHLFTAPSSISLPADAWGDVFTQGHDGMQCTSKPLGCPKGHGGKQEDTSKGLG